MPDPNHDATQPPSSPDAAPRPEAANDVTVEDDGGYAVVEPEPTKPSSAAAGSAPSQGWYTCRRGGPQEGPFDQAEIKRRWLSGAILPGDLVWREGMADWRPAREVRELLTAPPASGPQQPPPRPEPRSDASTIEPREVLRSLKRFAKFASCPAFFQWTAYVAAGLTVFWLVESVLLCFWGKSWFTGALLFAIIFVVAQGVASILEAVAKLTPKAEKQEDRGPP